MKILYLHITQNCSGVEKRFYHYYKFLEKMNDGNSYTVLLSSTFFKKYALGLSNAHNIKIIPYGFYWDKTNKLTRYMDYICILFKLLVLYGTKFDVVHAPTTGGRLFLKYTRSSKKIISIVNSDPFRLLSEISHSITKNLILNKGTIVDCLDENIKHFVEKTYNVSSKRIYSSPCSFVGYEGLGQNTSKEHSVIFSGRFIKGKGINMLLDQLDNILRETRYKVYILGRGPLYNKVIEYVERSVCPQRVIVDFVKDPTEILEHTEVFLSLQEFENYPSQSLIEAMMTKNVIIATNVGLTQQIVKPEFGFLIDNGSQLLDTLKTIEVRNADITTMGNLAYDFAKENHNVKKFYNYLVDLYMLSNVKK